MTKQMLAGQAKIFKDRVPQKKGVHRVSNSQSRAAAVTSRQGQAAARQAGQDSSSRQDPEEGKRRGEKEEVSNPNSVLQMSTSLKDKPTQKNYFLFRK